MSYLCLGLILLLISLFFEIRGKKEKFKVVNFNAKLKDIMERNLFTVESLYVPEQEAPF